MFTLKFIGAAFIRKETGMRSEVMAGRASRAIVLWVIVLLGLAAASSANAGGFYITVEAPGGVRDPRIKDAVLVVRAFACGDPTAARITATAEGLVAGKRQTVDLKVTPASSGIYSIRREWPLKGDWVVAIHGSLKGIECSKLVSLGPDGTIPLSQQTCLCPKCYRWREAEGTRIDEEKKMPVQTAYRRLTAQEIDAKLRLLADDEPVARRTAR